MGSDKRPQGGLTLEQFQRFKFIATSDNTSSAADHRRRLRMTVWRQGPARQRARRFLLGLSTRTLVG